MIRPLIHSLRRHGVRFFRKGLPWGAMLEQDISLLRVLPQSPTLFDVGANIGQTLQQFKRAWPAATVHCFEPTPETYETLQQTAAHYNKVYCHATALSSRAGLAHLGRGDLSVLNRILPMSGNPDATTNVTTVKLNSIDAFCREQNIDRIHVLKIDTEGHDLEVMRGATDMLRLGTIDLILTEVGFDDADCFCRDTDVRGYLGDFRYRLLGVYEQTPFYQAGRPHTRMCYANMLFIRAGLSKP